VPDTPVTHPAGLFAHQPSLTDMNHPNSDEFGI